MEKINKNMKSFCSNVIAASFYNYDSTICPRRIIFEAIKDGLITCLSEPAYGSGIFSVVDEDGERFYRNNMIDVPDIKQGETVRAEDVLLQLDENSDLKKMAEDAIEGRKGEK